MKALILDNKVVDVQPKEFEVHKSFTWLDAPEGCRAGYWELKDGVLQEIPERIIPWNELRSLEYPPIEEQLDMQYHDAVNGTTTWKDAIEKVKSDIPKE